MPTVNINSPTVAIVRDVQKIVMTSPSTVRHIHPTMSSFLPNKSPITAEIRNPTTAPTYIIVMIKSS